MHKRSVILVIIGLFLALVAIINFLTVLDSLNTSRPYSNRAYTSIDPVHTNRPYRNNAYTFNYWESSFFSAISFVICAAGSFFLLSPPNGTGAFHNKIERLSTWQKLSLASFFIVLLWQLEIKVFSIGLKSVGGPMQGVLWILCMFSGPIFLPSEVLLETLGISKNTSLSVALTLVSGPVFYALVGAVMGYLVERYRQQI